LYTVFRAIAEHKGSASQRENDGFCALLYTIFQSGFAWKYQLDVARRPWMTSIPDGPVVTMKL
jgi:hypothetical protein